MDLGTTTFSRYLPTLWTSVAFGVSIDYSRRKKKVGWGIGGGGRQGEFVKICRAIKRRTYVRKI